MAGRGRGRGQAVSFNIEQLGLNKGELPICVTQPPPLFPPLENQPLPLVEGTEYDYILVTQKDFNTRITRSPFFLKSDQSNNDRDLPVLWNRMPAELKRMVAVKRTLSTKDSSRARKGKRIDNPDQIFAKLEAKENFDGEGVDDDERNQDDDKEQSDEDRPEVDEDGENEIDEEMDEGTDYAREYFDNGENYLDDDDGDDGEAIF